MWREKLVNFASKFVHPAWGISHFSRVYEMSVELANTHKNDVDDDSLFAASYLHDIGAFEPYRQEGMDHADSAINFCDDILASIDFPEEKFPIVKELIKNHMFYRNPTARFETIIFREADILDFMGIIGITRLLSIVGIENWTPDLHSSIKLIKEFSRDLLNHLRTEKAREIGKNRQKQMAEFLDVLSSQTKSFEFL